MNNTDHPAILPLVKRLDHVENKLADFIQATDQLVQRADMLLDAEQHRTAFQRERAEYWKAECLAARGEADQLRALVTTAQQAGAARVQRLRAQR